MKIHLSWKSFPFYGIRITLTNKMYNNIFWITEKPNIFFSVPIFLSRTLSLSFSYQLWPQDVKCASYVWPTHNLIEKLATKKFTFWTERNLHKWTDKVGIQQLSYASCTIDITKWIHSFFSLLFIHLWLKEPR